MHLNRNSFDRNFKKWTNTADGGVLPYNWYAQCPQSLETVRIVLWITWKREPMLICIVMYFLFLKKSVVINLRCWFKLLNRIGNLYDFVVVDKSFIINQKLSAPLYVKLYWDFFGKIFFWINFLIFLIKTRHYLEMCLCSAYSFAIAPENQLTVLVLNEVEIMAYNHDM